VWSLITEPAEPASASPETVRNLRRKTHQTLRQVTRDFEQFEFNTIVSGLMELLNDLARAKAAGAANDPAWIEVLTLYVLMMAPVTPHVAEELWAFLGKPYSIHQQSWPAVDEAAAAEDEVTLAIQINGKVRDRITVPVGMADADVQALSLGREAVQKFLEGRPPRKVIVVPGKLVNIVG
jgi:leucyl-tRNA synthetase